MKRKLLLGAVLTLCCGCSTMNNAESGALGGGAIGGILGAGIGSLARAPGVGALIGAGTGAAIGGLAGAQTDREERKAEVQQAQAYAAVAQAQAKAAPRLDEIAQMAKNGVPDANIIMQVRDSGAAYNLTPDDIIYLSRNGVSSAVIGELQNHRPQPVAVQPVYTRPVVYVHDPYYYGPPPVAFGVGFGYGPRYRHGW